MWCDPTFKLQPTGVVATIFELYTIKDGKKCNKWLSSWVISWAQLVATWAIVTSKSTDLGNSAFNTSTPNISEPNEQDTKPNSLTPKQLETHGCVVNTVATDALVLRHQAISIHSCKIFISSDHFRTKLPYRQWTIWENEITYRRKILSSCWINSCTKR